MENSCSLYLLSDENLWVEKYHYILVCVKKAIGLISNRFLILYYYKFNSYRIFDGCVSIEWNRWKCRLPLCEVVSWNTASQFFTRSTIGLPLCEVVSWMFLRVLCGIADLIQWWESPDRRHSEPVVHIPEVWCRKELLYSYKFLSDSMKCPVFPVHFNHIFFCIFQIRSIIADSSKKKISLIDRKHALRKNFCMIWRQSGA